jgi:AcrR family transcriptional regulator
MELESTKPRPSDRGGQPAQQREHLARGRETIRKLLIAGMEVFGRDGYRSASVGDIVARAGISRATFYLYFANKDDLFRALALDAVEEMTGLADTLGPVTPDREGFSELRSWLERYLDLCDRLGPVFHAWTEAFASKDEFGVLGAETLEKFTAALERRLGAMGTATPQITALALVGMLDRFSLYVRYRRVQAARDEMLDGLTRVVMGMLFGPPAHRS